MLWSVSSVGRAWCWWRQGREFEPHTDHLSLVLFPMIHEFNQLKAHVRIFFLEQIVVSTILSIARITKESYSAWTSWKFLSSFESVFSVYAKNGAPYPSKLLEFLVTFTGYLIVSFVAITRFKNIFPVHKIFFQLLTDKCLDLIDF